MRVQDANALGFVEVDTASDSYVQDVMASARMEMERNQTAGGEPTDQTAEPTGAFRAEVTARTDEVL